MAALIELAWERKDLNASQIFSDMKSRREKRGILSARHRSEREVGKIQRLPSQYRCPAI